MMHLRKRENGLTLVELLATIVISSIVLIVVFSIFSQAIQTGNKTMQQTNERNEMVFICKQLDRAMLNIDSIEILDENGVGTNGAFNHFKGIDHRIIENPNKEEEEDKFIEVVFDEIEIYLLDGNLFIDDLQVNDDDYVLRSDPFSLKNGGLLVNLSLTDVETNEVYVINKFYDLKRE